MPRFETDSSVMPDGSMEAKQRSDNRTIARNKGTGNHDTTSDFHSWTEDNLLLLQKTFSLNPNQTDKVREMGQLLHGVDYWKNTPLVAIHFLQEHRWNVREAEKSFLKMIQWRLYNDMDTLLDRYKPHKIFDYFPVGTLKNVYDYEGDPIHIERIGSCHTWTILDKMGREEVTKHSTYVRELLTNSRSPWIQEYERQFQRPMARVTAVVDVEGMCRKHVSKGMMYLIKDLATLLQDCYPSCAKRVIIIRAPMLFQVLWKFLQPFLRENIKNLVVFASHHDFLDVLSQYLDISVLPKAINPQGGKGETLDEYSPVWEGGAVPAKLPKKDSSSEPEKATTGSSIASTTSFVTTETVESDQTPVPREIGKQPRLSSSTGSVQKIHVSRRRSYSRRGKKSSKVKSIVSLGTGYYEF